MTKKELLISRLMARIVLPSEGCWLWTGRPHRTGYGRIRRAKDDKGSEYVHVISYEYYHGPVPTGIQVGHTCKNRLCIRPDHLEAVTYKEKMARSNTPAAIVSRFGLCTRGHKLAGNNLYIRPNGWRVCRICAAMRARKHYARKNYLNCL